MISGNNFYFEVTTQSDSFYGLFDILIEIEGTNMIVSEEINKFKIRNREDFSVIKTI